MDGSLNFNMTADATGNSSIAFTGDFNITWKGKKYDVSWDFTTTTEMDSSSISYTCIGSYRINGYDYTINEIQTINLKI